jgi:hypothetical protein
MSFQREGTLQAVDGQGYRKVYTSVFGLSFWKSLAGCSTTLMIVELMDTENTTLVSPQRPRLKNIHGEMLRI